jgi:hypothetical protein
MITNVLHLSILNYILLTTIEVLHQELTYLHHKKQRVQHDEYHDKIFKWSGHNNSPNLVFEAVSFAGHVPFKWSGPNCEVNTRFLEANSHKI